MSDLASMAVHVRPAANPEPAPTPAAPPENGLTARMYPEQPEAAEAAAEPTPVTVDELVQRELTPGETLYSQAGGSETTPEIFSAVLGERFDGLEYHARHDGNEADIQALGEGRREAAALMNELQVSKPEARELTRTLGDWVNKPALDEESNWGNKLTTLGALEKEWGKETQARVSSRNARRRRPASGCRGLPTCWSPAQETT